MTVSARKLRNRISNFWEWFPRMKVYLTMTVPELLQRNFRQIIPVSYTHLDVYKRQGPVRTGKSTFIKRFMDVLVLPNMEDRNERERATDELPQSAAGKTIMTTEPKFVPKEACLLYTSSMKSKRPAAGA